MDNDWVWGDEKIECERRWIVGSVTPGALPQSTSMPIRQGYVGVPSGLRVRITGTGKDRTAEFMLKKGRGITRSERPAISSLEAAGLILESTPYSIRKRRYYRDGWEVDIYEGRLTGLIKAEFEMRHEDQPVVMPPWMHDAVEVTDTVSDELLAKLAYDLDESPGAEALRRMLTMSIPRIVLTGGPCSGKSAAMRQLAAEFPDTFHCVPEVASIVIREVGVSPPTGDSAALRRYNRAFGEIQRSFETVALYQAILDGKRALLMDRGTMDNAAYVPGGVEELERIYMSTAAAEYARYDAVIHIVVPGSEVYRRHMADNPARYEDYDDVLRLARHTIFAWSDHPNHIIIQDEKTWEEKYAAIRHAVMKIIAFP